MSPYFAEFLGTTVLLLLGDGVVANVVLSKTKGHGAGWIVITFGWAMAVFVGVALVGDISGAHLNPAVTVGMAVAGKLPATDVAGYVIAQMLGAMTGATLVWAMYRHHFAVTADPDAKLGVFCNAPAIRTMPENILSEVLDRSPGAGSSDDGGGRKRSGGSQRPSDCVRGFCRRPVSWWNDRLCNQPGKRSGTPHHAFPFAHSWQARQRLGIFLDSCHRTSARRCSGCSPVQSTLSRETLKLIDHALPAAAQCERFGVSATLSRASASVIPRIRVTAGVRHSRPQWPAFSGSWAMPVADGRPFKLCLA